MINENSFSITMKDISSNKINYLISISTIIYKINIPTNRSKHHNVRYYISNYTWSLDSACDGLNSNLKIVFDDNIVLIQNGQATLNRSAYDTCKSTFIFGGQLSSLL